MPEIIILKGLPASGKSSYAVDLVKKGYKRINNDDLRESIDGYKFSTENEKIITMLRRVMLQTFIRLGRNIVLDNTNFNPKCRQEVEDAIENVKYYEGFAYKPYEIVEAFVDTPVEECIRRDALRTGRHHVGKKVIMDMYDKYLKIEPKKPEYLEGKPNAIICDIDGTLALCGDRNIYDGSKAHLDKVIPETLEILERFETSHTIIICSGRDAEHREVTRQWLIKNNVPFDLLLMREEGDKRKDSIVKQEIYDNFIRGNYNIKFVLDDRNQVVDMWRANGLTCHQVAPGNF
jgi:predicted kinase